MAPLRDCHFQETAVYMMCGFRSTILIIVIYHITHYQYLTYLFHIMWSHKNNHTLVNTNGGLVLRALDPEL